MLTVAPVSERPLLLRTVEFQRLAHPVSSGRQRIGECSLETGKDLGRLPGDYPRRDCGDAPG